MKRGTRGARQYRRAMVVRYINAAWCEIWHHPMHKCIQTTTHFVYWWCRTCHRRWTSTR
jgi:hypothetical protein